MVECLMIQSKSLTQKRNNIEDLNDTVPWRTPEVTLIQSKNTQHAFSQEISLSFVDARECHAFDTCF